jgi:hypothetical protein
VLVHIFHGPGRVFDFTKDTTGANLPLGISPWNAFKSVDLHADGEPTPGVDTNACLKTTRRQAAASLANNLSRELGRWERLNLGGGYVTTPLCWRTQWPSPARPPWRFSLGRTVPHQASDI